MENACVAMFGQILRPQDIELVLSAIEVTYQSSYLAWQTLQNNPILMGMLAGGLLARFIGPSVSRLLVPRRR